MKYQDLVRKIERLSKEPPSPQRDEALIFLKWEQEEHELEQRKAVLRLAAQLFKAYSRSHQMTVWLPGGQEIRWVYRGTGGIFSELYEARRAAERLAEQHLLATSAPLRPYR